MSTSLRKRDRRRRREQHALDDVCESADRRRLTSRFGGVLHVAGVGVCVATITSFGSSILHPLHHRTAIVLVDRLERHRRAHRRPPAR